MFSGDVSKDKLGPWDLRSKEPSPSRIPAKASYPQAMALASPNATSLKMLRYFDD